MEKKLRELIKQSMINKDKIKQTIYKSILDGAQKIAKQTNSSVSDEMIIKAIKNEIKQLTELQKYCENDICRLAEIRVKTQYCEELLPKMATKEDMLRFLNFNAIDKNIGTCMKALKEQFGSLFDGKTAQEAVKSYIGT